MSFYLISLFIYLFAVLCIVCAGSNEYIEEAKPLLIRWMEQIMQESFDFAIYLLQLVWYVEEARLISLSSAQLNYII